jgi:hypothetical protein
MEQYMKDSYQTRTTLKVANKEYEFFSLPELGKQFANVTKLPYSAVKTVLTLPKMILLPSLPGMPRPKPARKLPLRRHEY